MLKPVAFLALVTVAGWATSCRAPTPVPLERVPLAGFAAALRTMAENGVLDPGEPASRTALGEGWGPAERSAATRFSWGAGPLSRLSFELVAARDLELRLRGWSYPFAGGGEQRVRLAVNGEPVGEAAVGPTATELRFSVEASRVQAGENILELRYARWNDRPGEAPWAVAWDRVRIVAAAPAGGGGRPATAAPGPPRIDETAGTIEVPAGTALAGTFELAAGSRLAWERFERRGDARLELAVAIGEEAERRSFWTGGAGDLQLTDFARPPGLVSFALRAVGTNGAVTLTGVHLLRPASDPEPARQDAPLEPLEPAEPVISALPGSRRPNLIVYLIDTLRADHLGCYGYVLPTSPRSDRFAAGSTLFRNGRAQSSWTKPAVASVLTGLYPVAHGAELRQQRIHESVETLAERLQTGGYETALFTTNANITARFGFAQGFETFRFLKHRKGRKHEHYDAAEMNVEIFAWLAERERRKPTRPLFLFVHTLDPHDPYRPREEYRRKFAAAVDVEAACCARSNELAALTGSAAEQRAADAVALYDAEIAQNDAAFGDFLDELARRGLAASSAVLLTADHGEEFLDHGGWKHGFTLYEEMLRIPFVLRLPAGVAAGRTVAAPVDQVDIAPTLLALAGLPPSSELPGRDVRILLDDAPSLSSRSPLPPALPTHLSFAWLARPGGRWVSGVGGSSKLVRQSEAEPLLRPGRELYDLVRDPRERTSLFDPAQPPPERVRWLEGGLASALARFGPRAPAEEAEIDPELDRSLRALGYL